MPDLRPAVRIILAPLQRGANVDERFVHGVARGRVIHIDPRSTSMGQTILHELLHVWHPSWSEARVTKEERKRWKRMSWEQKAAIYKMLGAAKIGNSKP